MSATSLPGNPGTLTLSVERSLAAAVARRAPRNPLFVHAELCEAGRGIRVARALRVTMKAAGRLREAEQMTIEELELAVKRLKLLAELAALEGKLAEREKWEAEAAEMERQKAAFAAEMAEASSGKGKGGKRY